MVSSSLPNLHARTPREMIAGAHILHHQIPADKDNTLQRLTHILHRSNGLDSLRDSQLTAIPLLQATTM